MSNESEDSPKIKSAISEKLIEALVAFYQPAESLTEADDTKSSHELISEMSGIEEIFPYEVNRLMEEGGFKLHYNGSEYVWLLKLKN